MVASKKCKVCTALDADNIAISGEYFEKSLPVLIEKLSGIQLDPRKLNGVLICKLCALQLLHADVLVDKLKITLQRLAKLVKETKPKTPSKATNSNVNSEENKLKSKSIAARRKSVFVENGSTDIAEQKSENLSTPSKSGIKTDSEDSKKQNEPVAKTPKKVVKAKSKTENGNEENNIENGEEDKATITDSNELNKEEEPNKASKKQVGKRSVNKKESPNDLQQNSLELKINSPMKFKKIADDQQSSIKSTPAKSAKRKQIFKENGSECVDNNLNKSEICEPTPAKRSYSVSMSAVESSSLDIDKDDPDNTGTFNESSLAEVKFKVLNCVICGKAFNQKSSLREHIEASHMGEKLKQCPNCSTEFRSQQKYESHVFSEKCKNSKHVCQYPKCSKRFKTIHKMELHMQEKHSSSQQNSEAE